jgi:hypothetical protein
VILNCKQGCKFNTQTTGKLNLTTNEVVCDYCHEEINNISSYTKVTMKNLGFILKNKTKSFEFLCNTCNTRKQVTLNGDNICGIGCNKNCSFNMGKYFLHAIKIFNENREEEENNE